jgi:uncharacterized protein (TIGR02611 family)
MNAPRFRAVARFIARNGRRLAITIAGFVLILAGVVMLVTPGPGWGAIFLGLAVLSREYVWARRALEATRRRAREAAARVRRKKPPPEALPEYEATPGPEHPSV